MSRYVQACPVELVNGSCPESLVWVVLPEIEPITWEQFEIIFPAIVTALLLAYGFRVLRKLFKL